MKIVTNGKKFRIMDRSGEFAMRTVLSPGGPAYETPWETRFYGRALKQMKRWEIGARKRNDGWVPV
jgi:hypothetical protein